MRAVMTAPVLISVLNYALLALVEGAMRALQPLFYATHPALGGLGLTPPTIGACLGAVGLLNGVFQACFFARIQRRCGTRRVFATGMAAFVPLFAAFPFINFLARTYGMAPVTWAALAAQLALCPIVDMAYGASSCYM